MSASSPALIVPINVLAFAVNLKDAHDATPFFSGSNTVFTDQSGPNQAFLGANVNRSLMGAPAQPLQAGVHLHWALPNAVTRAASKADGTLEFPAAPNRWLINRLVISGGKAARLSWVVLSDLLNDSQPSGQTSITLPTYTTPSGQDYQYSGQYQVFDQNWTEPVIPPARRFETLTGLPLSAVASGQSVFASFYPNCRGVFGFIDVLTDLKLPPKGTANLMYTVTGWYSDNKRDPLSGGLTLTQMQEQLGWTFDGPSVDVKPDLSLYQGFVQDVTWHPDETYLPDYNAGIPTIELDLSLGNNPPEAMSSYLQRKVHPQVEYFQTLMNGFFDGLLAQLNTPTPGQLETLEESLQEAGFESLKAGYIYTVEQKVTTYDPSDQPVITWVQANDLPARVGDALNLLNADAQAAQLLQESLANFDWQLFADWYRIFMMPAQQQTAFNIAYQKYLARAAPAQELVQAVQTLDTQEAAVEALLPQDCRLRQTAAPRHWQPNDLVFLLSGSNLPPSGRYGRSGQYDGRGLLKCRLEDQTISAATANGVTVTVADFAASALPTPNALPRSETFSNLLFEALILDAQLLSNLCGTAIGFADVEAALLGQSQKLQVTGTAPLLLAVGDWQGNPWVPLLCYWKVKYTPIFDTTDKTQTQIYKYPADFFTSQFTIEQNNGAEIGFKPKTDPAKGPFDQSYDGAAILSTSAIEGFVRQLSQSSEPVMQQCLDAIKGEIMVTQSISGLTAGFGMHDLALQLNIAVPDDSQYFPLTLAIAKDLNGHASIGPNFNSFYNPVRAGFLKVDFTLIDVFGQKMTVLPKTINIAESLTIDYEGKPVADIAYLPPRLSQAARLDFRFLAADSTQLDEMNLHPATTPICGWLLPNHLNGSLFIYDAQGASLGTLFLNDAKTVIMWQSAPGNNATIDATVREVMQDQQPQLRDLVVALSESPPAFFDDFMVAIDDVNGFVEPQEITTNNDLAVLIGRPVAVVQVSLALELKGTPHNNLSRSVIKLYGPDNPLAETDNAFTKIDFPVVLGNLQDLDDGLIGFFKFGATNYDWAKFYTTGAEAGWTNGVQLPTQNTVVLNARPGVGDSTLGDGVRKLLMLIDPRASIHATTGILPTKDIQIPSDMFADTLRTLEMTFMITPILGGSSALTLPLPNEPGYQWSWVQERLAAGRRRWDVRADVNYTAPGGPWTYTPQTILEGWLRLDPEILLFELFNADGKGIVARGVNNGLSLTVTNRQGRPVAFSPAIVPRGAQSTGSIFYIHFGTAVPQDKVADIALEADGWTFALFTDAALGKYWGAAPTREVTLAGGADFTIDVDNVTVDTDKQQITIFFDYYEVTNVNDGAYQDLLSVA